MDLKLDLIAVLYVLSLIHSNFGSNNYDTLAGYGAIYHDYYMNIKTSVDFQWMHRNSSAKWRNDSFVETIVDRFPHRCKVQLDHRDNCYLYLVKNQTKPTLHGPIKIDPKHIELDIEFDKLNRAMDHPIFGKMDKTLFESWSTYYNRCFLMRLAYKLDDNFYLPPLNIYLELDSKTASLFPKIEKNDYFMFSIINFFDEINPNNVYDKSILQLYTKVQFVTASHFISNYTIVPINN
uniref:Uncharacterized protein n=1 Tax=Tetranychus urticae TaxID=32264 RepID=T1JWW4_TETUR